MSETPLLVRDVPEEALLARIFPLLPTAPSTLVGPGDDCAVVAAPDGRYVVFDDKDLSNAFSLGTPTAVIYAIDNVTPLFAEALAGK